ESQEKISGTAWEGALMSTLSRKRVPRGILACIWVLAVLVSSSVASGTAHATQNWRVDSISNTTVAPGSTLDYGVQATNVGDAAMDGSLIALVARLPAGMTATDAVVRVPAFDHYDTYGCTAGDGVSPVAGASDLRCVNNVVVPGFQSSQRYEELRLRV